MVLFFAGVPAEVCVRFFFFLSPGLCDSTCTCSLRCDVALPAYQHGIPDGWVDGFSTSPLRDLVGSRWDFARNSERKCTLSPGSSLVEPLESPGLGRGDVSRGSGGGGRPCGGTDGS